MKIQRTYTTKLEIAGDALPAEIEYEHDPFDGAVIIIAVYLTQTKDYNEKGKRDPHVEKLDLIDWLSGQSIQALKEEIDIDLLAAREDAKIERWELNLDYRHAA